MDFRTAYFYDGAAVLIVVVCMLLGRHKGFVRAVLDLAGSIASLIGAFLLSRFLSLFVYERFMQEKVTEAILSVVSQAWESLEAGILSGQEALEAVLAELPGFFGGLLELSRAGGYDLEEAFSGTAAQTAAALEGELIAPMVTLFLQVIFFLVIFFVLAFLCHLIAKLVGGAFNAAPVVGSVNRTAGMALGLLQGIIVVYVAVKLLQMVLLLFGDLSPWLSFEILDSTGMMRLAEAIEGLF